MLNWFFLEVEMFLILWKVLSFCKICPSIYLCFAFFEALFELWQMLLRLILPTGESRMGSLYYLLIDKVFIFILLFYLLVYPTLGVGSWYL